MIRGMGVVGGGGEKGKGVGVVEGLKGGET